MVRQAEDFVLLGRALWMRLSAPFSPELAPSIYQRDKGVVRLAPANPGKHHPATPCGDVRIYQDFRMLAGFVSTCREIWGTISSFLYQRT